VIDQENMTNQVKFLKESLHEKDAKLYAFEDQQTSWQHEIEMLHTKLKNEEKLKQISEQNNVKLKGELEKLLDSFDDTSKDKL